MEKQSYEIIIDRSKKILSHNTEVSVARKLRTNKVSVERFDNCQDCRKHDRFLDRSIRYPPKQQLHFTSLTSTKPHRKSNTMSLSAAEKPAEISTKINSKLLLPWFVSVYHPRIVNTAVSVLQPGQKLIWKRGKLTYQAKSFYSVGVVFSLLI